MSTELVLLIGLVITIIAVMFSYGKMKRYWKNHVLVEIVRGGGSDSVKVPGKLVGNMLEIEPNKKYGIEIGKLYPFVADEENDNITIEEREADEEDVDKNIILDATNYRTAMYPTQYPEGLPSQLQITIRKVVVDEDNWEMRTRKGSNPMMNPDLLIQYEHEKTMGMMVVLSQTIQEYETKLQKALSRSVNPMALYAIGGIMIAAIGYLIYQVMPLIQELKNNNVMMEEVMKMIQGLFN